MTAYQLVGINPALSPSEPQPARAPTTTDLGLFAGPTKRPGLYSFQYLTGSTQSLSALAPNNIAVGDLFNVSAYSSTSQKCPATWKCTSINAALPSGAVAGDVTGNALGSLYVLLSGSTYYRFQIVGEANVLAFGAMGDGSTDDLLSAQAAMRAAGTTYFPAGEYVLSNYLTFGSDKIIRGEGRSTTSLVVQTGATNDIILYSVGVAGENLQIDGISFVGTWLGNQTEAVTNGLVTVTLFEKISIINCAFTYARLFSININNCTDVVVRGNLFRDGARDFIGVWGTPRVIVTDNILQGNDDDGISINLETSIAAPVRSQAVISNNHMTDTGGIKLQCPKNFIISSNTIFRPKGNGLFIGINPSSGFDESPAINGVISGNVITDVIDRQYFVDGNASNVNLRNYMRLDTDPPRAGGLGAVPGFINTSAGNIQSPYDYFYTTSGAANTLPTRSVSGISFIGNVCRRTLPAVSNYSDWGYGQAYTKTGYRNTAVSNTMLLGMALDIRVTGIDEVLITDNIFRPGQLGINFTITGNVDMAANHTVISNNIIVDCSNACISYPAASTLEYQDLVIEGNTLDGDPYFLSANRGAGGTWAAQTIPIAIDIPFTGGAVVKNNKIRNVAQVIVQTSASATQQIMDNLLFANPVATGFSTSNAGIGTIPGIGNGGQWWLQFEDSDPTSATYKQSLGANLKNYASIPTAGTWLAGTVVGSRSPTIAGGGGSQYIISGWVRQTTGSNHVLNTDWSELRTLTGT